MIALNHPELTLICVYPLLPVALVVSPRRPRNGPLCRADRNQQQARRTGAAAQRLHYEVTTNRKLSFER